MGCRTLFATHYHELTELEGKLTGIKNYCIAVKEKGEDIIFLHKIIRGGANGSYGIQVAKLAGLPELVLERAKEILSQLEDADISKKEHKIRKNKMPIKGQLDISSFITESKTRDEVIEKIKNVDVSTLTPLDALNLMYSLQQKLKTG